MVPLVSHSFGSDPLKGPSLGVPVPTSSIHHRANRIELKVALALATVMASLAALSRMPWHRWRLLAPAVQVERFDLATSVVAAITVVAIAAVILVTARTGRGGRR